MSTRSLQWTLSVVLAVVVGLAAGCSRPGQPGGVEAGKDAQGNPAIHVDKRQVERNVDQANRDLQQAGRQIREGTEKAGEAVEKGARKIDAKYGPVAREVLDDAAVTARVKARLIADPDVGALRIDVDTVDGRVTLNGKVASADERSEAAKLAQHTEGVKSVVNLIQVAGQQAPPPGR
jgi:hyperosmotically inducible periplasmic protein